MSEQTQNNGIIVKKVHPNAPKFARCKISFNVANFINTLQQNNIGGWVNMDVNESDKGDLYAKINTWQPNQQQAPPQQVPPQQNQYQQPAQQQPQYQQPQQGNQAPQQNQRPPQQQPQGNRDGGYSDPGFDPNSDIPFNPCH